MKHGPEPPGTLSAGVVQTCVFAQDIVIKLQVHNHQKDTFLFVARLGFMRAQVGSSLWSILGGRGMGRFFSYVLLAKPIFSAHASGVGHEGVFHGYVSL